MLARRLPSACLVASFGAGPVFGALSRVYYELCYEYEVCCASPRQAGLLAAHEGAVRARELQLNSAIAVPIALGTELGWVLVILIA